jgi:hypothetical protein
MQAGPFMQAIDFEREVRYRLPQLLAGMLDDARIDIREPSPDSTDRGIDLVATDSRGRKWLFEVKGSDRPGQVDKAAAHLRAHTKRDAIAVLVVPHMSPGGADAAERARLNWLDLSGNAHIRTDDLYVRLEGRPNAFPARGRPSSPFAPRAARVTRALLLDPARWWRQRDLVETTGLDDGRISRVVRRLDDEHLLERRDRELRPRDPDMLLDAWAQDYRFYDHDVISGHLTGDGIGLARKLGAQLQALEVSHAFTGLPAAWAIDQFARFRLTTVYIDADPRQIADRVAMRRNIRGANIQLVAPNDDGVFAGAHNQDGLHCVAPLQAYVDLLNLPERAAEAAQHLRSDHLRWDRAHAWEGWYRAS